MFSTEIVGTANALAAGWGNLGGGVTQYVMGSVLFPFFARLLNDDQLAWRVIFVFPALLSFVTGIVVYKISDDYPTRHTWDDKIKREIKESLLPTTSLASSLLNHNMWLLMLQYCCTVGVEQTMYSGLALYFRDEFDMTTRQAASIVSIFGYFNICARFIGGFTSDKINARMGMRGRICWQTICLLAQGSFILLFAHSKTLNESIVYILFAAVFMMAGAGSTYAIVPYINPSSKGLVSGVVGSGASFGAIIFSISFRQTTYHSSFIFMGRCIVCAAVLSPFIHIKGYPSLFLERDSQFFSRMEMRISRLLSILSPMRYVHKKDDCQDTTSTVSGTSSQDLSEISDIG